MVSPLKDTTNGSAEVANKSGYDSDGSSVVVVAEVIRNPPVDRDVIIVEQESDGDSSIADGEDTVGSAKVINLEIPSDPDRDYDSDETMGSEDSDLLQMIDARSEGDISVSDAKDYIELLDEKLERRLRQQKRRNIKKRSRKHRKSNACRKVVNKSVFKRENDDDDSDHVPDIHA